MRRRFSVGFLRAVSVPSESHLCINGAAPCRLANATLSEVNVSSSGSSRSGMGLLAAASNLASPSMVMTVICRRRKTLRFKTAAEALDEMLH